MKLTRRSVVLLVTVAVLAAFNAIGVEGPSAEALPAIPAVAPDSVVRVAISTPVDKLVMERVSADKGAVDFERWRIVTPLQFPADAAQIRTILRAFGPGIPMEAVVDETNHDAYGLSNEQGLVVELFTGGDVPAASVVIGKTAAGPSSFVRLPGADTVYRADVGGRGRYERPAADWRDKVALDVDRAGVVSLVLERGPETLRFRRGGSTAVDRDGNPLPGAWEMEGGPFPVDAETVEALVRVLVRIRAGEIHNPDYEAGFATPRARATFGMKDGSSHRVVLGGREEGSASFVRVDDRPEVFRTAGQVGRVLLQPLAAFRDRALFSFERAAVESLTLADGGLTVVLSQAGDADLWEITQPANMDADQRQAQFAANTLATLRAAGIPADTRFDPTGARITVRFRDGHAEALEIGQAERDADDRPLVRVRVSGREGVYQLKESTLSEIRKAFGRG